MGNHERYTMIQANLAATYISWGLYRHASQMIQEAYDFAKETNHTLGEVYYLGNLGWAKLELGETEKAIRMLTEAAQLADRVG